MRNVHYEIVTVPIPYEDTEDVLGHRSQAPITGKFTVEQSPNCSQLDIIDVLTH
jgi:hypothetical protein